MVGTGVVKPWAVSDHNRCEQQQSLAAITVAEAPVCQTCTHVGSDKQAGTGQLLSRPDRGKADQPVDTLPVQGASANDWRARYSSLSSSQRNGCGLEVWKYQNRGKFAGFILLAPKAMSRAFSAQLDRSALVRQFESLKSLMGDQNAPTPHTTLRRQQSTCVSSQVLDFLSLDPHC